MAKQLGLAVGTAIAVTAGFANIAVAQSQPPTIQLGGTAYAIEFRQGVFEENLLELQAQPWYAANDFTLAVAAAGQVYDCEAGSPFEQPACATPFDAFDNVSAGFGGLSPWFVYDVEAGVAATAVGFSDVTAGENVLRQVNTNLEAEQPFAIATRPVPATPEPESSEPVSVSEPMSAIAIILLGTVLAGSHWRRQQNRV